MRLLRQYLVEMLYRTFAVQIRREDDSDKCAVVGNFTELNAKALISNIERHAASPNRMDAVHADGTKKSYDMFAWADIPQEQRLSMKSRTLRCSEAELTSAIGHYIHFQRESKNACQDVGMNEFLASVNAPHMAAAENPQPDMLRISNLVIREILARGDVDVYKLTYEGAEKLSILDALKSGGLTEIIEAAIKTQDTNNLDKWAQVTAKDIVRKLEKQERGEQKKSHDTEIG